MTFSPTLIAHIAAGSTGFLTGAVALSATKGAKTHRIFGTLFVAAMLFMAASAAYLSLLVQPGSFIPSIFTLYLLITAWMTVRRKAGSSGLFEKAALAVALACAGGAALCGWTAAQAPGGTFENTSAGVFFFLALFAALTAAFDLKVILRGGIAGMARIARHLWRMCFAFFVAAASSAVQIQKLMPRFVLGLPARYIVLAVALAPLVLLVFWLVRVRFTKAFEPAAAAM